MAARSKGGTDRIGRGGLLAALLIAISLIAVPAARAETSGSFLELETLSVGGGHACAIGAGGALRCWGDDSHGQLDGVPGGEFASVSAGGTHSCAIRVDRELACWGEDGFGQIDGVPAGQFLAVSAGLEDTCAIGADGKVSCWGDDSEGQLTGVPSGEFVAVSTGGLHSCGIGADGALSCWGSDAHGALDGVPSGEFIAVSAGRSHTCAIRADGELACWGDDSRGQTDDVPTGEFVAVSAGEFHTCAIRADGELACWGDDSEEQLEGVPAGRFRAVDAGGDDTCATKDDGETVCWGESTAVLDVPAGLAVGRTRVAAGYIDNCGIRTDGGLGCWGWDGPESVLASIPAGEFVAVATGDPAACAIDADGELACWGSDSYGEISNRPSGEFRAVATGSGYACAIRADGELACWGDDSEEQLEGVPSGRFKSIGAHFGDATCAVRADGELVCFGNNRWEQLTNVPTGRFRSTVASVFHACAIRTDGEAACWGKDEEGQADAPSGEFVDLSIGDSSSCAIGADGTISCWGSNVLGRLEHPPGAFASLSSGASNSCALTAGGALSCWGDNYYGESRPLIQSPPPPRATIGVPYLHEFEVLGLDYGLGFAVTAGQLPGGLTLSEEGELSGVPTVAGDYPLTVAISNGLVEAAQEATLEVVGAPVVTARPGAETTVSGASIDAEVDPENLPSEAWFEYWPAAGAATEAQRTAVQEVPAGVAPVPISAQLDGLAPDTTYDYRAVARNEAGPEPVAGETVSLRTATVPISEPAPPSQSAAPPTAETPSAPPPVAGKSVDVEPTAGTVTTQCPGQGKPQKLGAVKSIPVGCVVDTRHGTATLTSVKGPGETESAQFWDGVFKVSQEGGAHPETVLTLVGPLECVDASRPASLDLARPSKGGRGLWGSGEGNFKTVGNYGSASVRGTIWFVGDRCDESTLFKVRRGTVWVRDFVKKKNVVLQKGQSYVASARARQR
ncbi:MAG TPA: putative Ig domain-containing protein [Solirubrobacterales bacterium]|nr:putative Ig domain-containing protein [Solirubrobacterales bacterium]